MGNSYRDLRVWQESVMLAREMFEIAERWPQKWASQADQMVRSARGVPACIAEGNGKSSRKDYVRLLHDAKASLQELESDVLTFSGTRLLTATQGRELKTRIKNTGRLLNALIRSLKPP